ncbi:MAG: GNAT family N-acetyltransferase [Terricaulis sp.]
MHPGLLTLEQHRTRVTARLPDVLTIANAEKEALGFLPHTAYREAADQGRLMLAVCEHEPRTAGFILFGGVFPHAHIKQIGVCSEHRRCGVGTFLVRELISRLEREGFLAIKAKVASDLNAAQCFYTKLGFEAAQTLPGGEARQRTIVVRMRHLETPSLIDAGGGAIDWATASIPLAMRRSPPGDAPFYAIDLNVLFDLVRIVPAQVKLTSYSTRRWPIPCA